MENILHPGRRIWAVVKIDNMKPFGIGPYVIVKFRRFLPRGIYEKDGYEMERKQSLIEVYTDPGGNRILAAANIRFRDPRRELG